MNSQASTSDDPQYRVIPYSPDLLERLRPLWAEQLGLERVAKREALFRWLTEGNPHRRNEPPYWLLMDGERVIGMHGLMPLDAFIRGERRRLHVAHDDLLALECRGKGLGRVMLLGAQTEQPAFSIALWHNEANRRLYAKSGWIEPTPPLTANVLVLDPSRYLRSRLPAALATLIGACARPLLALNRQLRCPAIPAHVRFERVTRFDVRFDEFARTTAPDYGLVIARDAAYLNWRFVDKPGARYTSLAATDTHGALLGWAVFGVRGAGADATGYIFDWLARRDQVGISGALLSTAVDELVRDGARVVSLIGSPSFLIESIRRLGFIATRKKLGFMATTAMTGWEGVPVHERAAWFLTHADGDGDAWAMDPDASDA